MILSVLVIAMLLLLFLRVPVAISMLLPCLVYVVWSPDITLGVALQQTVGSVDAFPLLAVPLISPASEIDPVLSVSVGRLATSTLPVSGS